MLQLEEKYKDDIMKLESILENQMRQKCLFRNDIKNLKLKTKSQPVQFKEIISSDKGCNNDKNIYYFTTNVIIIINVQLSEKEKSVHKYRYLKAYLKIK